MDSTHRRAGGNKLPPRPAGRRQQLSIGLPDPLIARLVAIAEKESNSVGAVARRLITTALELKAAS